MDPEKLETWQLTWKPFTSEMNPVAAPRTPNHLWSLAAVSIALVADSAGITCQSKHKSQVRWIWSIITEVQVTLLSNSQKSYLSCAAQCSRGRGPARGSTPSPRYFQESRHNFYTECTSYTPAKTHMTVIVMYSTWILDTYTQINWI